MQLNSKRYYARTALSNDNWETRYAALQMLRSSAESTDIKRIEQCLLDPVAPVKTMALKVLASLLALDSESAIKECLVYNDPSDPYGSLEVRETARETLDAILAHTRTDVENTAHVAHNV